MATGVLCFYLIISGLTHQSCLWYFLKQKRWVGLCQHPQTPKSPSLWTLPHTAVPTGHQSSGGCRHRGKVRVTRGHSIIRSTHLYRTTGQRLSIKRYTHSQVPLLHSSTQCAQMKGFSLFCETENAFQFNCQTVNPQIEFPISFLYIVFQWFSRYTVPCSVTVTAIHSHHYWQWTLLDATVKAKGGLNPSATELWLCAEENGSGNCHYNKVTSTATVCCTNVMLYCMLY